MNKIYKSVYNAVRGTWVVVSEQTSSYKQPSKSAVRCLRKPAITTTLTTSIMLGLLLVASLANAYDLTVYEGQTQKIFAQQLRVGKNGQGQIDNRGTLTIEGDPNRDSIYGITSLADENGYGVLRNSGQLTIVGNSRSTAIRYLSRYGTGSVINEGAGTILVKGTERSYAIQFGAYYQNSKLTIENRGSGSITFVGGTTDTYPSALHTLSYGPSANAKLINSGSGTITIQGGTGTTVNGIEMFAYDGATATIENGPNGHIVFLAGSGRRSDALDRMASKKGQTTVINKGTISALGNQKAFGIGQMVGGSETSKSSTTFDNHGTFIINKYGIGAVNGGRDASYSKDFTFINRKGGKLNVEAAALFSGSYGTVRPGKEVPVTIYMVKADGQQSTAQTNSFVSKTPNVQTGRVTLKDEWAQINATWEVGSEVNFTDIAEGTDVANSIREQFQNAFGTNATLNFTATGSSGGGSAVFNKPVVEALISEGKFKDGDVITSESLHLSNESFKLAQTGATVAFNKTGFKGILGAKDIAVEDGKRLTLMGDMVSLTVLSRATSAKPVNRITDATMTLTNGHLDLGIESVSATGGVLAAIANGEGSSVNVNNGVYVFESLTGAGRLNVGAKGQVYLTGTDNTIANAGLMTFEQAFTLNDKGSTFTKMDEPEFRNEGTVQMQDFTVASGAEYRNVKNATTTAKALTLHAGSALTNMGTLNVDSLSGWGTIRNKGTINVSGQLFVPGQMTQSLAGTVNVDDLVVGEGPQSQTASFLAVQPAGTLMVQGQTFANNLTFNHGNVQVAQGATLAQGMNRDAYETFAKAHEDLVKDKSVLVVSKSFGMGANDSLWVGANDAHENLALGESGVLVLTGNNLKGHAMFEANDGSILTADIHDDAQIVFEGLTLGNHYIARGFDDHAIKAFENKVIKDLSTGETMTIHQNDRGLYVTKGTDDIATIAPNAVFKEAINGLLDGRQGTGQTSLTRYLDPLLSSNAETLTTQTTKLAQLGSLAGVQSQGIVRHQMMSDAVFAPHYRYGGQVVWATLMGSDGKVKDMAIGNGVHATFDSKNYGVMVGGDLSLTQDVTVGAAFGFMKGDIKASHIKNEVDDVSLSLYGEARLDNARLKGALAYSRGSNDIDGFLLDSVAAKAKTQITGVEVLGQMDFGSGRTWVSPYMGVRGLYITTDDYTTKIAGQKAIKNASKGEVFAQIPVGVEVTHVFGTPSGWAVQGHANVGAVYTLGDREVENVVKADGAVDRLESDVMQELQGKAVLGLSVSSKHSRMDLGYAYSQGNTAKSHAIKADVRWVF